MQNKIMQTTSWLVLLLAVGLSNCDEYVCPTDIYPCDCWHSDTGINFKCDGNMNGISFEGLQKLLKKLSGKKIGYLSLVSINLEQASSELLNGLVISSVYFDHTNITEMPAFKGSENTLQKFRFVRAVSEKSIHNFTLIVSHLNKLKSVDLSSNYYSYSTDKTISVGNDCFANGPSSLETISLFKNDIKLLGDRVFSELPNLKKVGLSYNRIEVVRRSMFPDPAEQLVSIDLDGNKIKSLPEDIFNHMPALKGVFVSDNLISFLDERTWRPVWEQLDALEVGTDAIGIICDSTISWTFDLSRPETLLAYCDDKSYEEYRRKMLDVIIDEKRGLPSNKI